MAPRLCPELQCASTPHKTFVSSSVKWVVTVFTSQGVVTGIKGDKACETPGPLEAPVYSMGTQIPVDPELHGTQAEPIRALSGDVLELTKADPPR